MNITSKLLIALTMAGTVFAASNAAAMGSYLRKGTQVVEVFVENGSLYCKRTSDNFELCHGMTEQADGSWTGRKMKHPDMPGFMTFNGTVTFSADGLKIKGCAMGNSFCDAENWTKQ